MRDDKQSDALDVLIDQMLAKCVNEPPPPNLENRVLEKLQRVPVKSKKWLQAASVLIAAALYTVALIPPRATTNTVAIASLAPSVAPAAVDSDEGAAKGTTPALRATPPNLGGEMEIRSEQPLIADLEIAPLEIDDIRLAGLSEAQ